MKRRDAFRLIPLSLAGLAAAVNRAPAQESAAPGQCPQCTRNGQQLEPLSIRYLKKVRGMLDEIRSTQAEKLLEASYAIARTVMRGDTCWCSWDMGHSIVFDILPGRNGVRPFSPRGTTPRKRKKATSSSPTSGRPRKTWPRRIYLSSAAPFPGARTPKIPS